MGTITRYETDQTTPAPNSKRKPQILGVALGRPIAVKLADQRGKEETRIGIIFNEATDKPEVLLFGKTLDASPLQFELAAQVAEKLELLPAHLEQLKADAPSDAEVEEV